MSNNPQAMSGNSITVKLNDKTVGVVQSITGQDDYAHEPLSGIGDIHPEEHVPSMARHAINVEEMVLHSRSMLQSGVASENGDAALQGLTFDIVVSDKASGAELRRYKTCSYVSGSVNFRKHAIVVSNASFQAIDVIGNLTGGAAGAGVVPETVEESAADDGTGTVT
ncbi:MAG: hypothetical protein HN842_05260 [Gammaproteobacteria bacterium]|jgi:hypothetical protein|nr:hypothetical protein [Gammaproteobacteria bacterium]MBT7307604.1 hypothetical protein [Gammaproteobacteria bacterium]